MSKNLIARPAIFLVSLSFFYLQACNNSSTEAGNSAVESSTLKNDTVVVKQETPATTSTATSDSIATTTAATAIAKAETAEPANKTRVSPNKSDAKPAAEKPAAAPKVDHASIDAGKSLLSSSDCLTCHKVQEKVIGPAYTDIAKKYPENDANVQLLANKIISGGSGVWGQIPMTPHPSLQADDVKKMVMYILSLD